MLLYGDFGMNSYSVVSNEAMLQGNEALNASRFNFPKELKDLSLHCYEFLLCV
jgi:hypothetical protein